jgi:hypothetical protein
VSNEGTAIFDADAGWSIKNFSFYRRPVSPGRDFSRVCVLSFDKIISPTGDVLSSGSFEVVQVQVRSFPNWVKILTYRMRQNNGTLPNHGSRKAGHIDKAGVFLAVFPRPRGAVVNDNLGSPLLMKNWIRGAAGLHACGVCPD